MLLLLPRFLSAQAKEAQPDMPVRLLDTKAGTWSAVECGVAEEGEELPRPRGGHSVCATGSKHSRMCLCVAFLVRCLRCGGWQLCRRDP